MQITHLRSQGLCSPGSAPTPSLSAPSHQITGRPSILDVADVASERIAAPARPLPCQALRSESSRSPGRAGYPGARPDVSTPRTLATSQLITTPHVPQRHCGLLTAGPQENVLSHSCRAAAMERGISRREDALGLSLCCEPLTAGLTDTRVLQRDALPTKSHCIYQVNETRQPLGTRHFTSLFTQI